MKEKDFQAIFNRQLPTFIDKFPPKGTLTIESKLINLSKRKSIPFSEIKEHQVQSLLKAQDNYLTYKLPDTSFSELPFDLTVWRDALSYVCLFWWIPRKLKEAHLIPLDSFIEMQSRAERKSITYYMSEQFKRFSVTLR